jgi:hypothetical protein
MPYHPYYILLIFIFPNISQPFPMANQPDTLQKIEKFELVNVDNPLPKD